ncbi:16154_t:CDS:1, partial [Funneliformis caledonium]
RRARWIMELQQHHFTIEHRAEKHNANADVLSRMYDEETAECFIIDLIETDIADNEYENNSIKEDIEWHITSPESGENDEWFKEE